MAIVLNDEKIHILNDELVRRKIAGGVVEKTKVTTTEQLAGLLAEHFGIMVEASEALGRYLPN